VTGRLVHFDSLRAAPGVCRYFRRSNSLQLKLRANHVFVLRG